MSKYSPASWLNRSRVFSDSSVDISAKSEASLAGLKYASQSSMEISGSVDGGACAGVSGGGVLSPLPSSAVAAAAAAAAAAATNEYTSSAKKTKTKLLRQWTHTHEESNLQSQHPDHKPSGNDDERLAHTPQQHNKQPPSLEQQQQQKQQNASRRHMSKQKHHIRHKSMPFVSTTSSYHHHNVTRDPQGYGPYHRDTCTVELDAVRALRIDPTGDEEDDGGKSSSSGISYSQGGEGGNSRSGRSGSYNSRSGTNHRSNYHNNTNRPSESFEIASCISGLSADETHCDDSKSYKSNHSNSQFKIPKGRDFGNVFNHLIHEPYQRDDEHYYNINTSSSSHSRSSPRSTSHVKKQIRKPTHYRAQSDTMALHHHAYGRQPSHFQQQQQQQHQQQQHHPNNYPPKYHKRKKSLPAHATLREQIIANHVFKPQLLQTRSTSLTTAQSQSTASSSCAANSTQPSTQPSSTITGIRRNPSSGSGISNQSFEQSEDGTTTNSSSHSLNSTYYKQYNDLLGTRPRRKLHRPISNNQLSYPSTEGEYTEDRSLQDVPEDDPSTNWNDSKSVDGSRSVLSKSTNGSIQDMTAGTPRSRKKVKDEMKFILKKLIPARLMITRNTNVTLERSEGCLT